MPIGSLPPRWPAGRHRRSLATTIAVAARRRGRVPAPDVRVTVSVAQAGALRPAPPSAPSESNTVDGLEKPYAEGGATVRERVRRIDGQTDVTLMRADGIVVKAQGMPVPAADLKALVLAIKPL